jgi:glycosyltransferase involved in cell wall biosynthesis
LSLSSEPNGAIPRYTNFSRWLREDGWSVHFAVSDSTYNPEELNRLQRAGVIDSFSQLKTWRATGTGNTLSRFLIHPGLRNRVIARQQAPHVEEMLSLIERERADACIISDRNYLFTVPHLTLTTRIVIDWCDSYSLFYWRALCQSARSRSFGEIPGKLYEGVIRFLEEYYYARFPQVNLVVSPVDQKAFRRVCPAATDVRVVLNGVDSGDSGAICKIPDRLVFSGRMDFPPNYEGALWFIDHVLPAIRRQRSSVHLVVVGANPIPALVARQSSSVLITGMVEDMKVELAQATLYVAPLVSGSGFKNKVFESIAAGTAVVGTSLAAEFLPPEFRNVVLVTRNAEEFASVVIRLLENPGVLSRELSEARLLLRQRFSWQARTADLLSLLNAA